MKWADDDIKELTRIVFRHAGNSVDYTKMKVESEVHLINKELNVTGRANMVISKNGQHLVVVDCKRAGIDYSKDTAQIMLAAEILLTEKLKNDESSSAGIDGLLAGSVAWIWLRLGSTEGRFYIPGTSPCSSAMHPGAEVVVG
ncbi:hypothetical protein PF008_g24604 [Phytophthora fragariae]|uniref:Uncharacterized protein n=1 Tax=Phytophthora fragariae TaxID=53985 RepID=A0A6G0QME4_9STRA|nr:hypothetical protein PF008_g24604 [Phytophthora fragariae]